jgi:hypothetical protein
MLNQSGKAAFVQQGAGERDPSTQVDSANAASLLAAQL